MVRDGEHANTLFYQYVKMREKQNQVPHLRKDDGTLTATPQENLRSNKCQMHMPNLHKKNARPSGFG